MTVAAFDIALVKRPHTENLPGIKPVGFKLRTEFLDFQDVRRRFLGAGEWDAAEVPLGRYIALKAQGDDTLTAIPVFPWRSFRHGAIHVRNDGTVANPRDLEGRRVGVTDWFQTASIVARGLLANEYGVRLDRINWISGSIGGQAHQEVAAVKAPCGFVAEEASAPLSSLLAAGKIDAIIAGETLAGHKDGSVTHLIADHEQAEAAWYEETGIFPLMHVIAVRRAALGTGLSTGELERVFETARRTSSSSSDVKWRYGVTQNDKALNRLLSDAFAQGIGERPLRPGELFETSPG